MPTGPGLYFRKKGKSFAMESMLSTGKKASLESLEWLEYLSSRSPTGTLIEHAFNKGEATVAGYQVDGYCEFFADDLHPPLAPFKIAFEYMGTLY